MENQKRDKENKECIFCKIVAKKKTDQDVLYESENFIAFPDINQEIKGHTLIIPKKHYENIMDMPATYGAELITAIKKVAEKILKEGNEGFNVIINTGKAAEQLVFHLHIHIIPRKKGDGIKHFIKEK